MIPSEDQLRRMFPNAGRRIEQHLPFIVPAMIEGSIDTAERIAAFLAQLAHESAEYRYMEEIADGSAYEGRRDLGNVQQGDGRRYKGHGPIQITGRWNHARCGAALNLPLLDQPTLICLPEHGTRSAAWYWNDRALSPLADVGDFREITRRINGGFNGWKSRVEYWERNRRILGLGAAVVDDNRPACLRRGDTGADVVRLQEKLGVDADGDFGPVTEDAVKAFQAENGLFADGIVGEKTHEALGV